MGMDPIKDIWISYSQSGVPGWELARGVGERERLNSLDRDLSVRSESDPTNPSDRASSKALESILRCTTSVATIPHHLLSKQEDC